ncbi:MAG: VOC family protein [Saprospiraceae bacterium]|nr:VOC family protein [Saprospiraceae bacterium]MBK8668807.1 VOC family protein [Saprospiraceae bacterium]
MKKVTGIGGIFFKTNDPKATKEWYAHHLGFNTDEWGASFTFRKTEDPSQKVYVQWSPFKSDTDYFEPSSKEFMINYRVDDIENLVKTLRDEGVTICDEIESYDYGKFVHIMDADGNKIELWEPVDEVFDQMNDSKTE